VRRLLFLLPLLARAQPDPIFNTNAAGAYEALLRLRTTVTVLHITAHPDDEDGALLTWLSRHEGVRSGLFTLTRGEGGANLIGPEQFEALGLLRTEELLASDRYYGVDQFFSRAIDFGFSKRLDETFEHWNREELLRDAVRVVREYRPDIIIARFHGASRDGHGNHQAAGVIATEVFRAAADAKRFPSEGRPWQPAKLFRSVRPDEPGAIKIDTGIYDPLIGMSYRQVAAIGLSYQRSQGHANRRADPGPAFSAVIPVEPAETKDLFDGLDTTLAGLAKLARDLNLEVPLEEIEKSVNRAIEDFDARAPSKVVEPQILPALRNLRAVIKNINEAKLDSAMKHDLLFRLRNKEDEFVRAVQLLAGIVFEANSSGVKLINRSNLRIELNSDPPRTLGYNEQASIGIAAPQKHASVSLAIDGVDLVLTKASDATPLPAVSVTIEPPAGVIPLSRKSGVDVHVRVSGTVAGEAKIRLEAPADWIVSPSETPVRLSGESKPIDFHVTPSRLTGGEKYQLHAVAEFDGAEYREGYQTIAHPDLATRYLFRPADATLTAVDLKVTAMKVGYISGAGDEVAQCLEQIGLKPDLISDFSNLSQFDTIIVGIRSPALQAHNQRLIEYVRDGGNLIVQYQTEEFGGPYPLQLGRNPEEVSEENARVTILDSQNSIFNTPNKITAADFAGWIEERGSKFMTTWDPQYKPLLESHDRDQPPQKGGLLQAHYGKGTFNYVAYAFYRQLPAGVPGAYRLFANLISAKPNR
jgi:LmbE family N-acetylglucosaminyl deacetylase